VAELRVQFRDVDASDVGGLRGGLGGLGDREVAHTE
jgi:hypothetical protein